MPKVALRRSTVLNHGITVDTCELEVQIELLPVLADAGKHGLVKYVIQNELLFASANILKINYRRGQFCEIPCKFVSAPKIHRRFFFRLCLDRNKLRLESRLPIEDKRFLELLKIISAYQSTDHLTTGLILDAFQLWSAELNGCDYFLTVDFSLIKRIRKGSYRPLTEVVKPSELINVVFNNPVAHA